MTIVQTEDTLGGKPRLEGRRISALEIAQMYKDRGKSPDNLADARIIGLDEVQQALGYYDNHPVVVTGQR